MQKGPTGHARSSGPVPSAFYGEEYFVDPAKDLERDSGYRDYQRASVRLRAAALAFSLFALFDFRTVLDAGCAFGYFADAVRRLGKRHAGVEISRFALEHALPHARPSLCAGSVDKLPFREGAFDLVVCQEVLEHLPRNGIDSAIEELKRVSERLVFLTVPLAPWAEGLVPEDKLPVDRRGYPHHGHLTVADENWWNSNLDKGFRPWERVPLDGMVPKRPEQGIFAFSRGAPPFASPIRAPKILINSLLRIVFR